MESQKKLLCLANKGYAFFVRNLFSLPSGNPFHDGWSFFLEDSVTTVSAFYASAAQLKFFGFNLGAAFHAFIGEST